MPNKYYTSFLACKQAARGYAGNLWNLGAAKDEKMQNFQTWDNQDGSESDGDTISGEYL